MMHALLFWLLAITLPVIIPPVYAQQSAKLPRVGYLTGQSLAVQKARNDAFRDGLRELGYVEEKNIVIEWRSYEGDLTRQRAYVDELVRLKVDVIVAIGSGDIQAAKDATTTIPIVMVAGGDPVTSRFVASLAAPGGNITGLATLRPELSGKRLKIIKDIVPRLTRVSAILSPDNNDFAVEKKELEGAAAALKIKLGVLQFGRAEAKGGYDFQSVFASAAKDKSDAILFRVAGPLVAPRRPQIIAAAVKYKLPVIYESAQFVEAGGLASYGTSGIDGARRAATYVDKILKGRKPADLPVEQPMKFDFVINLKAAKQIGLTVPPEVLARANRVIR